MSLHFNLFIRNEGFHYAAWRLDSARPEHSMDVQQVVELARLAERGLFDSIFLADSPSLGNNPWQFVMNPFEPLTLLSAVAMVTSHIGLIGTLSTTYNEPYNLARQLASLDHISSGRAGWNIVTTQSLTANRNFGGTQLSHSDRYARAREFVQVVRKLWDSWEDDAVVADKSSGVYVDPAKVHRINHAGTLFQVAGPHNIPRSPQGHPLLVQAGSSGDGMDFGASVADAIFTAQNTLPEGRRFYRQMKDLARRHGRDPESIKILPGLAPLLGSTVREANELAATLEDLTVPDHSLTNLSTILQVDLFKYPYDGPVPIADVPSNDNIEGARSRNQLIVDLCARENLTIRDLVRWHITGATHRTFIGTPEQLVDDIETWLAEGAADGFNLMPSVNSSGLGLFVEHVIPLLQKRGLFRREYDATTLRGNFGLTRVERTATELVSQ